MTVRSVVRRGERRLVIDIKYRNSDGSPARFRRDAEVQTLSAARAEERRRLVWLATTGTPEHGPELPSFAPAEVVVTLAESNPRSSAPRFAAVVKEYLEAFAPSHLKPSTQYGYEWVLRTILVPEFGKLPIDGIDAPRVRVLDARLVREHAKPSTRRNVQSVLRSVLSRFAVECGYLTEPPRLPRLPRVGATVVRVLSSQNVADILAHVGEQYMIAFLLAAFAGLRSGEIRALRWRDVDLVRGRLVVRQSLCRGEFAPPKSGHEREVPLVPDLRDRLNAVAERARDALVTRARDGEPWSQFALLHAFRRAAAKTGLVGWRFHDLRHYFVTALFRSGASAPVVRALAGHANLTTTQRYAHVEEADLEGAIHRLRGNGVVTSEFAAANGSLVLSET